ncbi:MAG: IS4 family transposase [Aliifodinibius sp.]|nr:IS4 family transposase [candidate division KSB1 bacterium]NIT56384.1 IS4 family transposase [Fodinibius sp.]NIV12109.1 IS4 family transposase [Fodinibius sp.]NIY24967.1 IS4 family transposase [Fodinibius sp.]
MRATKLLHKLLGNTIHAKRIQVLGEVVETVLYAKTLSVTGIGRNMMNHAQTRSNIRKVDRLLSNPRLQAECSTLYQAVNRYLLVKTRPTLSIDGSKLPNSRFYTLRATLQLQGRGLTVYETLYTQSETGSQALYQRFLSGLAEVLPAHCKPILVTDAEFRASWFRLVIQQGWDFIGRVRGNKYLALEADGEHYQSINTLFKRATAKPKALGQAKLNKQNAIKGQLYLYKAKPKGRHAYTRSGRHSETEKSLRAARSAAEGWVLFSSLKRSALKIVKAYQLRMTIEESFRDHKSGRYGLGLAMTRSRYAQRYQMMLMLAMLAAFIAYLLGCVGEMNNVHYQFQANSTRKHRVLSRFFLGCNMFYRGYKIILEEFNQAIALINDEVALDFSDD